MPRLSSSMFSNTLLARRLKNVKVIRRKADTSAAQNAASGGNKGANLKNILNNRQAGRTALFIYAPAEFFDKNRSLKRKRLIIGDLLKEGECGLPVPEVLRLKTKRDTFAPSTTIDGWTKKTIDWTKLPQIYLQLSKARLSTLVVITALGGYALCPAPFDPLVLSACGVGTCLMSFSANALNQFLEAPFDSQMKRTQSRVLVRRQISATHAFGFALASGCIGFTTLWFGANPTTAALGLANVILYSAVYTPMKRFSIYNTWVGSIVGAIPPMMGWAACSGGTLDSSAVVLAAILFAWQFPHFNSLSWNLRSDYSNAGYRMMSVARPDLLGRTTVTYSLTLLGLSSVAVPLTGITTWTFAMTSLPLNLYFLYNAFRFYKETDSRTAKTLFRSSLIYLPILMTLMLISKRTAETSLL